MARSLSPKPFAFPPLGVGYLLLVLALAACPGCEKGEREAEVHYRRAADCTQEGKYSGALWELNQALKIRPREPRYHFALARVLKEMGRLSGAENSLREALKIQPENLSATLLLGEVLEEKGAHTQAEPLFRECAGNKDLQARALEGLVSSLYGQDRLREAAKELRRLTALRPGDLKARVALARVLTEMEDLEGAAAQYEKALQGGPVASIREETLKVYLDLADREAREGRPESAIHALEKAVELEESPGRAARLLGFLYAKTGHLKKAAKQLQKAGIKEEGEDAATLSRRLREEALRDEQDGKYETALLRLDVASLLDPSQREKRDVLRLRLKAVETLFHGGSNVKAENAYLRILRDHPHVEEAHLRLAEIYERTERTDQAIESLKKALPPGVEARGIRARLGGLLLKSDRYGEAIREFERIPKEKRTTSVKGGLRLARRKRSRDALEEGNAHECLLLLLHLEEDEGGLSEEDLKLRARALEAIGFYKASQKVLEGMWRESPEVNEVHHLLGRVHQKRGQREKAFEFAKRHFEKGKAFQENADYTAAIREYESAVDIEPWYFQAFYTLGLLYGARGRYPEALKELDRAESLRPDEPEVKNDLGVICGRMGRYAEAEKKFLAATQLDPQYEKVILNLSILYGKMGRTKDSLFWAKMSRKVGSKKPRPGLLLN